MVSIPDSRTGLKVSERGQGFELAEIQIRTVWYILGLSFFHHLRRNLINLMSEKRNYAWGTYTYVFVSRFLNQNLSQTSDSHPISTPHFSGISELYGAWHQTLWFHARKMRFFHFASRIEIRQSFCAISLSNQYASLTIACGFCFSKTEPEHHFTSTP